MTKTKSHFWYNKSQRNGILYLSVFIVVLQLVYYFVDFSTDKVEDFNFTELITFQNKIDSLKRIEIEKRKPKIYPFNPSFITDYKGYKLGMSTQEIDRLLKHRKNGKYINSAKQFQQVTKISDSLLNQLKPYFKFPDWISNKKNNRFSTVKNNFFKGKKKNINLATQAELQKVYGIGNKLAARILKFKTSINGYHNVEQLKKVYGLKSEVINNILERFYIKVENTAKKEIQDLNTASANDLKSVYGIGEKLSARIIKYRNSIGGFYFNDQVNEVYGLKPEIVQLLFKEFQILSKPKIEKLNVNEAAFKQVLHLPYIDFELTKKIFDYRNEFAEIQHIEELKKIEGFPLDKYDRIVLYLTAE